MIIVGHEGESPDRGVRPLLSPMQLRRLHLLLDRPDPRVCPIDDDVKTVPLSDGLPQLVQVLGAAFRQLIQGFLCRSSLRDEEIDFELVFLIS